LRVCPLSESSISHEWLPMIHSLLIYAALLGQLSAENVEQKRDIRLAARQLGATDYASRESAYRTLWRYGLSAEPALRKMASSPNAETRLRARRLLRDIEYGILPSTEIEVREAIAGFRDGSRVRRDRAWQWLVAKQQYTVLERLIRFEPTPQVRQALLLALFQSPAIAEHYVERNGIESLIERVGIDQDDQWKRTAAIQLMFAPATLSRLAESGTLDTLLKLIQDEADPQRRQSMLAAIFRTSAVGIVLVRGELRFLLDVLRAEPNAKFRGELLRSLFANQQAAQAIAASKKLDAVLAFSKEQTNEAAHQKLIEQVLVCRPIVQSLLEEGGIDRIVSMAASETDPVRRGRLLGATIASSAVRTFLQRNGLSEFAIKLAKQETHKAARHEFLQALLHDTSFIYSLKDDATVADLWKLIKADEDSAWRAQSLVVLLQSRRSNGLLKDPKEATWILNLASNDSIGPAREDILRYLLPNANAQRVLIADGHFDKMLSLARSLSKRTRGEILANFLAGSVVAQHLIDTEQIELLLRIIKEQADDTVRQQCLQGVFRNSTAMTALLEAGHYGTFLKLIQNNDDPIRRANLFVAFIQSYRVMEELAKRGDSELLLSYLETDAEGARRQFLPRLFQNQRAVALLMDEGYFDRLLVLAKKDGGTNFDELLRVPKVLEHLIATAQFDLFLDFAAEQADDNTRRSMLRNLFVNQTNVEALIASNHFSRLLRLIQAEHEPTWRASLLGAVLSSSAVVSYYADAGQLRALLTMIAAEPELVARGRILAYLTNRSDSLAQFVEHGHLDALLALANEHTTGRTRGDILARVISHSKSLQRLEAEQRVGQLLSYSSDQDAKFTAAYLSRLFLSTQAIELLVEHGYYRDIFVIATTYEDARLRTNFLSRVLQSSKALDQLVVRGDTEALVAIVTKETNETSRRIFLATLLRNETLVDEILKNDLFSKLVKVARANTNVASRRRDLATLLFSAKAIARLAEDGELKPILLDALSEPDVKVHEAWFRGIIQNGVCFTALVKRGYGDELLDATEQRISNSTRRSLQQTIFSNQQAIAMLFEQGHFEKLLASAKRSGSSQLARFLSSPQVIERFVAKEQLGSLITIATEKLDRNDKRTALYALVRSSEMRQKLLDAGQLEAMCEAIQRLSDANMRSSLFSSLLSSSDVVRSLIKAKQLDSFFQFVETKATPAARSDILSLAFLRSDTVDLMVEQGLLERLVQLASSHIRGDARGNTLARIFTSAKTLDRLIAEAKIDQLLVYSTSPDGDVDVSFVKQLLSNRRAVNLLIERGYFDELHRLATESENKSTHLTLLRPLLTHPSAIERFANSERLSALISTTSKSKDDATRRATLAVVCANELLVSKLIDKELFAELVEACDKEPEQWRRRLLASLLLTGKAIEQFATDKRLDSLVSESLAEPDRNIRVQWLTNVLTRHTSLPTLIQHGQGMRVLDEAVRKLDRSRRSATYRTLLSNSEFVKELAKAGEIAFLFKMLDAEQTGSQQDYLLSRLTASEDAMRAITLAGELDKLLNRVKQVSRDTMRKSVQQQVLLSYGTLSAFSERGELHKLFEILKDIDDPASSRSYLRSIVSYSRNRKHLAQIKQPSVLVSAIENEAESHRSSIVMRLASDTNLRRRWIEAGQLEQLEKMIAWLPSESTRTRYQHSLYYTPSGVLGQLLREKKFAEAEVLLKKYSGDRAMGWFASYLTSRGTLNIEAMKLQERTDATPNDLRRLVYFLRASGDLPRATSIAEKLNDPRLLRPLFVEQREWESAAKLQAVAPLPPPVQFTNTSPQDSQVQRIEQLGMLASYWRLAEDDSALERTAAEVVEFAAANKSHPTVPWHAAEALLLNDQVEDGLRLAAESRPLKAFNLFLHRQDYHAAFKLVGIEDNFVADREWYDGLPFGKQQSDVQRRFSFAFDIARQLRLVGRDESAESILAFLETLVQEAPEQGKWPQRFQLSLWHCGGLSRIGENERALDVAVKLISQRTTNASSVVAAIYESRSDEARVWWSVFQHLHGADSVEQRLRRIGDVLNPTTREAVEKFPALARQAIEFGKQGQVVSFWRGLAKSCISFKEIELAIECFEQVEVLDLSTSVAYADALFSAERWAAASETYFDAWQQNHDQLGMLYLAGIAKQRAGNEVEGQTWQELADLQAVMPKYRYRLALALTQRGLANAASKQWKILLRTAPFESLELNDAARHLAMAAQHDNPKAALPLWQHYVLGDVRPAFWFLNDTSYLSVPASLHKIRARAVIAQSDFGTAKKMLHLALELSPGDTNLCEEIVPTLDAAGQQELANQLVDKVVKHYERLCKTYPDSALLHNNLSWVMARSHRHLKNALLHAERAVELAPANAGYIDTLAEVNFHLGDRETAIRLSEQSVQLLPKAETLQKQLTRFQTAPLP
jgi:tetratricopeptide (TPR) repeat protein